MASKLERRSDSLAVKEIQIRETIAHSFLTLNSNVFHFQFGFEGARVKGAFRSFLF